LRVVPVVAAIEKDRKREKPTGRIAAVQKKEEGNAKTALIVSTTSLPW
jgi:hypothetical protein